MTITEVVDREFARRLVRPRPEPNRLRLPSFQRWIRRGAVATPRPTVARIPSPSPGEEVGRLEAWLLVALFAAIAVMRVVALTRVPYDSDEWQHLHVAWAYSQGETPYLDLFDNHMPLFHLLVAPFVAVAGERVDILDLARLLMVPVFAATLWATFSVGKAVYGRRAGLWAAALIGLHSDFFYKSLEFRTDDLWGLFWLLCVRALVAKPWSPRRGFVGGLFLGAAFGVSLKTVLPAVALGAGALALPFVDPDVRRGLSLRRAGAAVATVAGGALVIPGAIAVAMAILGAFRPFLAATVGHSGRPGASPWSRPWGPPVTIAAAAVPILAAALLTRARSLPGHRPRQTLVLMIGLLHGVLLFTAWPGNMPQDNLSLHPVLAVIVAGGLLWAAPRWREIVPGASPRAAPVSGRPHAIAGAVVAALALFGGTRIAVHSPGRDGPPFDEKGHIRDVLLLTERSDFVMDAKGESVFRDRPFRPVLEKFTKAKLRSGEIPDTIPERCVETRTCVASASTYGFPPRAAAFLESAYVRVGHVRVAGTFLGAPPDAAGLIPFEIGIPAAYAVVSETGVAAGVLDGSPYAGPRFLDAGRHEFRPAAPPSRRLAVVWSRAIERGFSPFAPGSRGEP